MIAGWLLSGAAFAVVRVRQRKVSPRGLVRAPVEQVPKGPPGHAWSRWIMLVAMTVDTGAVIAFVALVTSGRADLLDPIRTSLPPALQGVGLVGYWAHLGWGVATLAANPTYTPCFREMATTAVLATGGPYARVRHPYYAGHAAAAPLVFLLTGLWPVLVALAAYLVAMPAQAAAEEEQMRARFGPAWDRYAARTPPFVPRWR